MYPRAGAGHLKDINLEPCNSKGNRSGARGEGSRVPKGRWPEAVTGFQGLEK